MYQLHVLLANIFFCIMGAVEMIHEGFVASIKAAKKEKIHTVTVDGFGVDVDLDENGMCYAPDEMNNDPGSTVSFYNKRIKLSVSAGFTAWLLDAKEIPCNCQGTKPECPRCNGTGTAKDRYAIQQPALPVEEERNTVIAILLDSVRNLIKAKKYNYMVFVPKGNPTMILCTMSALRELTGTTSDGKAIKRAGYFAGYSLYDNISEPFKARVAILKDEAYLNGQLLWNVGMALDLEVHAIRHLKNTILKGSARSIHDIELQWSKRLLGIDADVHGIATHEFVKRVAKSDIVEDADHFYVIEFDIRNLVIVNPPLRPGLPGLGLSLWKYGKLGTLMNDIVTKGWRQLKAITLLKSAMSGEFDSECKILNVKMPKAGEEIVKSDFHFPLPLIEDGTFVGYRNPKNNKAWSSMWKRFYKFFLDNILRIEVDGLKSIVASCSVVLDAYEEAYHLQLDNKLDPGAQKAFAILPACSIFTSGGKITMGQALTMTEKTFVLEKDPASSIRHFIPLTPVGEKSMITFLLTGNVVFYEDDTPILGGRGAVVVSSTTMQYRMCVQDFDGDQPKLLWIGTDSCPPCPVPVDWVKEFVTKDTGTKVDLQTEQEELEYYSNLMLTVVAARQAIAPMVLGSLAGYIEVIVRAVTDRRLSAFPAHGWDGIQKLLSAIAEIYAIKKEKSMADSADKKTGWIWVDMFLDLYLEAKDMIPVFRDTSKLELQRAKLIRSLIRPSGERVVENHETGEYEIIKSSDPYDIMRTLASNAKKGLLLHSEIFEYFPSLSLTTQFADAVIQKKSSQSVTAKATRLHEMKSDIQKQRFIFERMLGYIMDASGITQTSGLYVVLEAASKKFINILKQGHAEAMEEFSDSDNSIEKTETIHEFQARAVEVMIECGLCTRNESKPWLPGESVDSDREFLFALLVGVKDMAYSSRETEDGRVLVEGKRASFNKCTTEGIRRCIVGYFSSIELLTVEDYLGNGDMTLIKNLPGYHLPKWVGNEVLDDFSEFSPVYDEEEIL